MSVHVENKINSPLVEYLSIHGALSKISLLSGLKLTSNKIAFWMARSRQRKQLATLDARLLKDIGLTKEEVQQEIAKPFWR